MGPTNFAEVIRTAKNYVVANQRNARMYNILLILTDGLIHDMADTINEIADIADSNLPLSIVIVGVGNEDFGSMVKLDGDEVAIRAGCKDIVQFVKFQEVVKRSVPAQLSANLSAIILEEIPNALVKCFMQKEMFP
jgi:hypothetical protein